MQSYYLMDSKRLITYKKIIEGELDWFGIKLNKQPSIEYKKKDKGGIIVTWTYYVQRLNNETSYF